MATTLETITGMARSYLRDFGQYFEVEMGLINKLTFKLPHPNVSGTSLQVYVTDTTTSTTTLTTAWALDERNGLLKITDNLLLNQSLLVSGYFFAWFLDSDLGFHVTNTANEHLHDRPGWLLRDIPELEQSVIAMGAVVKACWALSMELARDIDVSTPEGMFIPASKRYSQVLQMMQMFEGEYQSRAAMLNVGLFKIESYRLRRISKMTNRYVPIYRPREIDDHLPPRRLLPPIDSEGLVEDPDPRLVDVIDGLHSGTWPSHNELAGVGLEIYDYGISNDGWFSIGTQG